MDKEAVALHAKEFIGELVKSRYGKDVALVEYPYVDAIRSLSADVHSVFPLKKGKEYENNFIEPVCYQLFEFLEKRINQATFNILTFGFGVEDVIIKEDYLRPRDSEYDDYIITLKHPFIEPRKWAGGVGVFLAPAPNFDD